MKEGDEKGFEIDLKEAYKLNLEKIIKLDYPELYKEPTPIFGAPGTLILFDTDIFHLGGKVSTGKERKLIRSHWYPNFEWRVRS
jgi:hypothetical protein